MGKEIFTTIWRNKWITAHAGNIDDFINTFEAMAKQFIEWKEMGINLCDDGGCGDDYATFCTDNMDVAIKAGFVIYYGDDKEKFYLETLSGKNVEVPKEKLK